MKSPKYNTLITLLILALSQVSTAVIFGSDSRKDWFQVPTSIQNFGLPVAALIDQKYLEPTVAGLYFSLNLSQTLDDVILETFGRPACLTTAFQEQPSIAFCSGFLIEDNIIVTAGSCITTVTSCADTAFVFDFDQVIDGFTRFNYTNDQIFYCSSVIEIETSTYDYAVLQMDRPITGRQPFTRFTGLKDEILGQDLLHVGFPAGIPKKFSNGTAFEKNTTYGSYLSNIDASYTSRGGPVIDLNGTVIGIVTGGGSDYIIGNPGNCEADNICPGVYDPNTFSPCAGVNIQSICVLNNKFSFIPVCGQALSSASSLHPCGSCLLLFLLSITITSLIL